MSIKNLVILIVFTLSCSCLALTINNENSRSELKKSLVKNCEDTYSLTCLKLDAVSWVDKLNENDELNILPGVSLVRDNNSAKANNGDIVAEVAREFPDDPNARLNSFLIKKLNGFLNSHSLKFNLWNSANEDESAGTARKKDKKGDSMGMMLAVGAMMKGMLMSLALAGLAAIAGKALLASLLAFLISAIVGLKGMSSGGGGHSTYEVLAKPVSHHHSHEGWDRGYDGYGRSLGDTSLPEALQPGYKLP